MRRLALVAGAAVALSLGAAACGPTRRTEPISPPLRLDTAREQRGEIVYMRACNQCHPGGAAGLGPALGNKPLPDSVVRLQIRKGLGDMPGFPDSEIPDEDLEAIVAYVSALRRNR